MRKYLVTLSFAVASSASLAHASGVGLNIGINLVNLPVPVVAAPPVAVVEPPEFIARPGLGFYVAVGTPNDLFYADNRYYLCRGDAWYEAPYYNGPWISVGYRALPGELRRYPIARLRDFREEMGSHRGEAYGHFRPERHGGPDRLARSEGGMHGGMMGH